MNFLYMCEYRPLKPVEATLRRGRGKRMNLTVYVVSINGKVPTKLPGQPLDTNKNIKQWAK
jgi:hypothetical protein